MKKKTGWITLSAVALAGALVVVLPLNTVAVETRPDRKIGFPIPVSCTSRNSVTSWECVSSPEAVHCSSPSYGALEMKEPVVEQLAAAQRETASAEIARYLCPDLELD